MSAGDGPVDAMFLAIEQITGVTTVCKDFRVQTVTVGKDAQAEVNVEVEHDGRIYRGRGVSTDSVEASAKAFLNAINRIAANQARRSSRRKRRRESTGSQVRTASSTRSACGRGAGGEGCESWLVGRDRSRQATNASQ